MTHPGQGHWRIERWSRLSGQILEKVGDEAAAREYNIVNII
jgi:hypothetical protein